MFQILLCWLKIGTTFHPWRIKPASCNHTFCLMKWLIMICKWRFCCTGYNYGGFEPPQQDVKPSSSSSCELIPEKSCRYFLDWASSPPLVFFPFAKNCFFLSLIVYQFCQEDVQPALKNKAGGGGGDFRQNRTWMCLPNLENLNFSIQFPPITHPSVYLFTHFFF